MSFFCQSSRAVGAFAFVTMMMMVQALITNAFTATQHLLHPSRLLSSSTSTVIYYRNDESDPTHTETSSQKPVSTEEARKQLSTLMQKNKKPTIYPITSLLELQDFLEDDSDRLTAIKFYAPWCKSCQRLGLHFQRLAVELGDGVVDRHAVKGKMQFAQVEYGELTAGFVTEQLQIPAVPTLQLYRGTRKLWESSGKGKVLQKTQDLKHQATQWLDLLESAASADEVAAALAEVPDDGILQEAMEDAFFDNSIPALWDDLDYCL